MTQAASHKEAKPFLDFWIWRASLRPHLTLWPLFVLHLKTARYYIKPTFETKIACCYACHPLSWLDESKEKLIFVTHA
jgi:hypothetical protein